MHFDLGTVLIATLVIASVVLVFQPGDRVFPLTAAVASGIEALIAFHLISLPSAKFRIDVILPAILVVAGGVCWARAGTKPTITSATIVTLLGVLQLVLALHLSLRL